MIVLAIETSCDETAAAVVERGTIVRSNVIASQHDLHAEYGGVVPEIASRAHVERLLPVVREALKEASIGLGMIDAVAVGNRPGLIGSLLVGVAGAKALAWALGKPLVAVDHVRAHLYSGVLAGGSPPAFPALGLVVSGGHTSLYLVRSWTALERLGSTIDDAVGEAFDKAAAILGIPYPGGPNLDRLAREPGANDRAHEFPIARLAPESLDFSFSGLKTSLLYRVRGVPQGAGRGREAASLTPTERRDLAASFQRAAVQAVILKLERALPAAASRAGTPVATLLTGGGVTANTRLREELRAFASRHTLDLRLPPMDLCMDNAAMIAGLASPHLASGITSSLDVQAHATALVDP